MLVSDGTIDGTKAACAAALGTRVVHPDECEILLDHLQRAKPKPRGIPCLTRALSCGPMDLQTQSAFVGAASGLAGALIGGGATMLGARIQWQGERRERDRDRLDRAVTECASAAGTMAMELGYKTPKQMTTPLQSLLHSSSMMICPYPCRASARRFTPRGRGTF